MKNGSPHSLWFSYFRIGDILHALSYRGLSMVTIASGVTLNMQVKNRTMRLLLEALQNRHILSKIYHYVFIDSKRNTVI